MNGRVRDGAFSSDSLCLYTCGNDAEIYKWDLRKRKCMGRWTDDGAVKVLLILGVIQSVNASKNRFPQSTRLCISPDDRHVATGSTSGVVNLFKGSDFHQPSKIEPRRSIMNLRTTITDLQFNHDGNILAMSSADKKDGNHEANEPSLPTTHYSHTTALRVLHVPSATVFANWPTAGTPLSYVSATAFSPESGYFTVGNDKGKVLLYRLNHYTEGGR